MRIFTRYIWHEVLSHAFLGGALFTFILFMKNIGELLEMAARNSASLGSVAKVFVFLLPNTLTLTIPMAVLVGVLLGLSRLSADSEITAMRAVGIGAWFFVRVVSAIVDSCLGYLARQLSLRGAQGNRSAPATEGHAQKSAGIVSRFSHASSMKTSRTTFSTCRISVPAQALHAGSASSLRT